MIPLRHHVRTIPNGTVLLILTLIRWLNLDLFHTERLEGVMSTYSFSASTSSRATTPARISRSCTRPARYFTYATSTQKKKTAPLQTSCDHSVPKLCTSFMLLWCIECLAIDLLLYLFLPSTTKPQMRPASWSGTHALPRVQSPSSLHHTIQRMHLSAPTVPVYYV